MEGREKIVKLAIAYEKGQKL